MSHTTITPSFDTDAYKTKIQSEFNALLQRAEAANKLYFLINLFNGWGMHLPLGEREHACSMDFNVEINRLTNASILDKIRGGSSTPILPQDILFTFQCNMEQKGFYAAVRNFINIAKNERAYREPWKPDEWSKHTNLKTTIVIRNTHKDLQDASCTTLANEFKATHMSDAKTIRNAIAHGNFRIPHAETGEQWVFGNYKKIGENDFVVTTTRFTEEEFITIFWRFLLFRLAFSSAVTEYMNKYADQSFSFQAANQMDGQEILDCHFDKGTLSCKYRGTPFW